MATRLQCHIGHCASSRRACGAQGINLSMRLARACMESFAHYLIVIYYHASDTRIRMASKQATSSELQSTGHVLIVKRIRHHLSYSSARSEESPRCGRFLKPERNSDAAMRTKTAVLAPIRLSHHAEAVSAFLTSPG